jgi:hypothetical protein
MVLAWLRARSMIKIRSKNSLYHHSHFTEHLVGTFGKSPRESNLNHESSSLLIWWLKNTASFTLTASKTKNQKHKSRTRRTREWRSSNAWAPADPANQREWTGARVCSDWNLQTTLKSAAKTDKATGLETNGAIQTELNGRSERSDREKQQS